MEKRFVKGDEVGLKSGGPRLTVLEYQTTISPGIEGLGVLCCWFDKNHHYQTQIFPEEVLELI